ncbi:hypothetical protein APUTEX25_002212 [Auxenochlorella protothecoides]|uniref:Iron-containing redox enzyme family protein n=1 Tax=Auxenochlorella protothecoides TaxID=3075 RepID=A0A3M7KZW6_AUXPR|nr:hypothetical protein APUTEX25_002212 [Auxenochlorella protothecoides]|eukprot:RMZ55354.1 hypothetical protein APUTEX25_002212 [Auxenochlorella protothecoides]
MDHGTVAGAVATQAPPCPATVVPASKPGLISHDEVRALESSLDHGHSVRALYRFDAALRALSLDEFAAKLRPVMLELAFNLESFNPAFTAVLLKVQSTIGLSGYHARDEALKRLILPLAGEYGLHADQPQGATHRALFAEFYEDLLGEALEPAMRAAATSFPPAAAILYSQMMRDVLGGWRAHRGRPGAGTLIKPPTAPRPPPPSNKASYALGYNLAIEYLADVEKRLELEAFRHLDERVLAPAGRRLRAWEFLEVHAEGEAEHAAIGHAAACGLVPADHAGLLHAAAADHDRDFAAFYDALAAMLE